ncbi:MAG: hypothetical protein ACI8O8_000665 [Oleiphilaceae bacterium]|jgi:hypothetical protein
MSRFVSELRCMELLFNFSWSNTDVNNFFTALLLLFSVYTQASDLNSITEIELDKRYQIIKNSLENEQQKSYWWQHGWETAYGISSLTQAAKAFDADNSDDEIRFGVGAAKSAIAFGFILTNPLPALNIDKFEAEPALSRAEKISRLERAEKRIQIRAQRADNIHTWARHGSAIVFNILTSSIISIYGNDKDAITSAVSGIIASEVNIWTQPSGVSKDWQKYQAVSAKGVSWFLLPTSNGIALNVTF